MSGDAFEVKAREWLLALPLDVSDGEFNHTARELAAALRAAEAAGVERGRRERDAEWVKELRRELEHHRDLADHANDWISDRIALRAVGVCRDIARDMGVSLDAREGE